MSQYNQDPFYLVKVEIQDQVNDLQAQFARWSGLGSSNPEKSKLLTEMSEGLNSINWQLTELGKAVEKAEQRPEHFNLTWEELNQRKMWVNNTKEELHQLERSINGKAGQHVVDLSDAHADDPFMQDQTMKQELLLRQQDQNLDDMSLAVGRIGDVGRAMHEELWMQGRMLDELDEDITGTQSRLKAAQRKISDVMSRMSFTQQVIIIVVLVVIFILLAWYAFS